MQPPYSPSSLSGQGSSPGGPQFGPGSDEKVMAGLSHLSILLPQFGWVVPLIIWLIHREGRTPFAAFQAKQAFIYHLSVTVAEWLAAIVAILLGFATFGLGFLILIPLLGLLHIVAAIYGIIGGIKTFNGEDFRYPIVGNWVQPD